MKSPAWHSLSRSLTVSRSLSRCFFWVLSLPLSHSRAPLKRFFKYPRKVPLKCDLRRHSHSGLPHEASHARPFEPQSKVKFQRFCQLSAVNAPKMAPRTSKRLQERAWDNPTKGLLWKRDCSKYGVVGFVPVTGGVGHVTQG